MVNTEDFPQADRLTNVGQVAVAISQGKSSDTEIESFIGMNSEGRQGRYYRKAAEILGLVATHENSSSLTPLGLEFVDLNTATERSDYLAKCIVETPVFQGALNYINTNSPTQTELNGWFASYYPGALATAIRRRTTFQNYLLEAGLVGQIGDKFHILKFAGGLKLLTTSNYQEEKVKYIQGNLPSQPKATVKSKSTYDFDALKLERAKLLHWKLVDGKAKALIRAGIEPATLGPIDLFAKKEAELVFYEMKSIASSGENFQSQIRKAISQLYEYRYLAKEPSARLCIVTSSEIPKDLSWMKAYLPADRLVAYEWTSDFDKFQADESSRKILGGFSPT